MFKIIKIFISVIIGAGIFYGGFYIGANVSYWYLWKKETQWVRDLADSMKQFEKEDYERAMADTYGGKTPQETLQMFIDAVEKGDYELASKYFVEGKRKDERKKLSDAIDNTSLISILKRLNLDDKNKIIEDMYKGAVENFGITESQEEYIKRISELYQDTATMSTEIQGYTYTINFFYYPNGIWKLTDI